MKIAFIDQRFHERTRSSEFFAAILENLGTVDHFYIEPTDATLIKEISDADYDLYVLWQLESYAPFLLYKRKRVLIVPMLDASMGHGRKYWKNMQGARALNFSRRLSLEHEDAGLENLYLQYFPNPDEHEIQRDFDELRGFFWQRRPEEGINCDLIKRLVADQVVKLHCHNAPDTARSEKWPSPYYFTESHWFENRADFENLLSSTNLFFAPRICEGIGMSFLEAMARGMCVVAADFPTCNEYITNNYNGILYPTSAIQSPVQLKLDPKHCAKLGFQARALVEQGYERFTKRQDELYLFVKTIPTPRKPVWISQAEENRLLDAGRMYFGSLRKFRKKVRGTVNVQINQITKLFIRTRRSYE